MKKSKLRSTKLAAGAAALMTCGLPAFGQSVDALLDKLVDKGVLTVKESNDLKQESDKNFTTAFQAKTGMPDWVTGYKFSGDFRGRYEQNNAENSQYFERDRFRYRLRVGATISMVDNFEVGLRLASGNPMTGGAINGNPGGLPITANQDMNSLDSRKFIWIDAAYGKWTPIKTGNWTVSGIIGKMDNPFQLSNMIWDYDIAPEGGALQLAYNVNSQQTLKANAAFFMLDEINQGVGAVPSINPAHDPSVYGAQVLWESKWTPKLETSLGVAAFDIVHKDSLSAKAQPFYNSGNSRDFNGFLKYNMNPVIGTASATYTLDSFPLYTGAFPLKVMGEYMDNPGAPANNKAFRVGVTLGKAGRKNTWEISYRYQRLEADAWFDALEDDDNGAFYASPVPGTPAPQLVGTGKNSGWYGGTNVKGHLLQATYNFTDFVNVSFTYYLNDLIIGTPGQSSKAGHIMADIMWKF
jgi:Putative porin